MLPLSVQVWPGSWQSQYRVAAGRVPEPTHVRSVAVGRNSILARRIGKNYINDPSDLSRLLVEVALGALLHQRPVLTVVAGMTQCGDQVAVAGQGLRQHTVPGLGATDAMTQQDQRHHSCT